MDFSRQPDEARLWIYAADRPLTPEEQHTILATLRPFLEGWTSHQRPVHGEVAIRDARFLLFAAHIPDGDISGCGIDKSVHAAEQLAQSMGFSWLPALTILYRDAEGHIRHATRAAFRKAAQAGAVTAETLVFDPGVATVGALRQGRFEQTAASSWHAQAFQLAQPAG